MLQLKRVLIRAAFNNGGEYDFSHWDQCSAAALLSLCFLNQIYTLYAPIVDHCLHHCFHEGQEKNHTVCFEVAGTFTQPAVWNRL